MAVYKKTYRPYEGGLTASWRRLLVIPRYAFEDLRRSRFLTIFYILTFIYPLICALIIYVQHNASALRLINAEGAQRMISINVSFYMGLLGWQSMLALFLAAFIGPGQVSPDLSNNALSLYLARPFSRTEYVLGKMLVLVILISLMTWVPGLLLFGLEGYLEGWDWMSANSRIASGLFFGSWVWILALSLLALALSAWVKWKPAAGGLIFGIIFVGQAFGAMVNHIQRTSWGYLFDINYLIGSIWVRLFEGQNPTTSGAVFFRAPMGTDGGAPPLWCSWILLTAMAFVCLQMLRRKIRGAEVVR
jgi:ABC-2 type transport system permease protein